LYWDQLACIVPYPDFQPNTLGPAGPEFARVLSEAHERFFTGVVPTHDIKQRVHERVSSLLDVPAPAWCRPDALAVSRFPIFDVKLAGETKRLLRERGWASENAGGSRDDQLVLSRAAGCVVMSELANVLGTPSLPLITEDPSTFLGNCNALLWRIGASRAIDSGEGPRGETTQDAEATFLVTRFLRLAWDPANPLRPEHLSRLIQARQDAGFNELRERFCDHVDAYVSDMQAATTDAERSVIEGDWQGRLGRDRVALEKELRAARLGAVTHKDGMVATVAGLAATGGGFAALGPIGIVIGLSLGAAGIAAQHRQRRQEAMDRRWSSWLFAAEQPRLKLL